MEEKIENYRNEISEILTRVSDNLADKTLGEINPILDKKFTDIKNKNEHFNEKIIQNLEKILDRIITDNDLSKSKLEEYSEKLNKINILSEEVKSIIKNNNSTHLKLEKLEFQLKKSRAIQLVTLSVSLLILFLFLFQFV
ncbi:hypothetical protein [Mongoliibacter ruber]|uniref:Uncharacterized protein n=1 Tax=Mongoliibacter ruber TaxID=1750599 RepID=A0A2T0WSU5_9BACT|nr:hypothetical protein [Mongoliibacter ruber]PRY89760.1 hypothetical protein CLW00_102236 [Mongoliibacter ruber]